LIAAEPINRPVDRSSRKREKDTAC